ncbi:DUF2948 family protein [Sneathiella marina]|uniref:DUF2948 family protein n=1 Tax=Sneathiella marina TaxID=2950108 RepID=A0ABY4W560_9PROT|nr:DUF2948 family protein [Sneathiella marina]USG62049.1 DUF2948 family protein [Sneathiella marina]
MPNGLKLIATDADELGILSAALEGTITSPGEMSFLRAQRSFTLMGSRFMWEEVTRKPLDSELQSRIRSGLLFSDVLSVRSHGISQDFPKEILELLTVGFTENGSTSAEIRLNFAGGGAVSMDVECVNVTLTDTGEAWPTKHKPIHEDDIPLT